MKKICILSAVNIKHMSLISLYTEKLKIHGISFDIIYMDKYGEKEVTDAKNQYVFTNIVNSNDNKIKKTLQYFRFKKFAIPILERNNYDFIIVWNDIAIFMFAKYLSKKWKNKYCLNIRDYAKQDNFLFKNRYKRVIENSAFSTISSEGFKNFLPDYQYTHIHSFNPQFLNLKNKRSFNKICKEKIRISFIGNIRFFELNKKLMNIFKNDNRFELGFYGTNASVLNNYAKKSNIKNVDFYDSFPLEETPTFFEKMDIVNNLYGSNIKSLDYAISIKLYYGVFNKNPILVNKGTYSSELIEKYKIGFVIDEINETLPDRLYKWYQALDPIKFNENCERFLIQIEEDNDKFNNKMNKYILN